MKHFLLAASLLFAYLPAYADPQTSAFTYQGNLTSNGAPANGTFNLTFKLFDAATGGNQIGTAILMPAFPVANGRFTTDLDFPAAFAGQQRWVEVTVGTQTLAPRQPVDSVPVAQFALSGPAFPADPEQTLTFSFQTAFNFPTFTGLIVRATVVAPDQTIFESELFPVSSVNSILPSIITLAQFGTYTIVWKTAPVAPQPAASYTVSVSVDPSQPTSPSYVLTIPVTAQQTDYTQSSASFTYTATF